MEIEAIYERKYGDNKADKGQRGTIRFCDRFYFFFFFSRKSSVQVYFLQFYRIK